MCNMFIKIQRLDKCRTLIRFFPHRFNRDTDPQLRRAAHKVLGVYRKTGRWNIL